MKISFFFLFLGIISLSATSHSQEAKVTIDLKNRAINELFSEIKSQTSYSFWFDVNDVDTNKKVTIRANNQAVKDVLATVFKGQGLDFEMSGTHIIITKGKGSSKDILDAKNISQDKKITGLVTDEKGEPIIGASVVVKGTKQGTVTDLDGKFELNVAEGAKITISYIGYNAQEFSTEGKERVRLVLKEDAQTLDEVVVVGYGTQRKSSVTGSIAAIKGDEISKVATSNLGSALTGRLPGLIAYNRSGEPGSDNAQLTIRGFDSPLVIVDGVEVRDFQKMDPNDIESLSILKDASASIYGARAGNGVILIKTKRGIAGKSELSFSSTFSWQSSIRPIKLVNVNDFIMLWNEASENSGVPERKYTQEQIEKYQREGGTDWYGETFKNKAPMQQYNLNLRGGNEKVKYYVAAGHMHQAGLLRSNDQQINRYQVRSNLDIQLFENLSLQFDLSGIWNKTDVPALSMWDTHANIFIARPTDPAYWPNHNYAPKSTYHGEWASTVFSTRKDFRGYKKKDEYSVLPAITLNYDFTFLQGLSAKAFFNYRIDNTYEKQFDRGFAIYDYNYDTDIYTKQREYPAALREQYWRDIKSTPQVSLNFNRKFGEAHDLSALALFEYNVFNSNNFKAERRGFLSNEVEQLPAGDPTSQKNDGGAFEEGRVSWVGRVNYAYKQKYLAEALVRIDGSGKFANDKRYGTFPGISLGWRLSEENFLKGYRNLDMFKLRTSFGMAGNDNNNEINRYQYLNGYSKNGSYVFGTNQTVFDGLATRGLNNPYITWEKTKTYNLGTDYSFWNRKLYGEVDVFYRKVSDVFGSKSGSLPNTFGASLPQMNINSYDDRGFELTLGHVGFEKGIRYSVEGNVSWTRSKWNHYDEPVFKDENEKYRLQQSNQWRNRWFGYKSEGLFRSQEEIDNWPVDQDGQGNKTISPGDIRYKDLDGDNILTSSDVKEIGRSDIPELMFGLKVSLQSKGFDFNMLWQGAGIVNTMYGGDLRRPFLDTATPHTGFMDRFHPEKNPNGSMPRMSFDNSSNNDKESDFWIQDATYVRLKNIEFGYSLPKSLLLKTKISGLRFFVAGMNFLTFDNVDIIDPEVSKGDRGWRYPVQKTMSFGFTLEL